MMNAPLAPTASAHITAIVLTFNEQLHIRRCIESLLPVVDRIVVVDSHSTDNTLAILAEYPGVVVIPHAFHNHAAQVNFAIAQLSATEADWLLRIDADEYLDARLAAFIQQEVQGLPPAVTGVYLNRKMRFLGQLLQYGGMSDYWILRLWRHGLAHCEPRWMDEHMVLTQGDSRQAPGCLIDDNLNALSWWARKHVDYATREAIAVLQQRYERPAENALPARFWGSPSERTRYLKLRYLRLPLFIRPIFYFMYRYLFRCGFLDGKSGFLWHVLQGFWYRIMVDANLYEITKNARNKEEVKTYVSEKHGYKI
ncbi:MAG: glycosyltransferase family 2 protein [Ferrimonas sp.]